MNWYEFAVFGLNFLGASVSAVVNGAAAGRRGMPVFRRLHVAIATLGVIYAGSYVWLAVELIYGADMTGAILTWSSVMRGVALVAWPAVWIMPAVYSLHIRKGLERALTAQRREREP